MNWKRFTDVCILTTAEQRAVIVIFVFVLGWALLKHHRESAPENILPGLTSSPSATISPR